jgi:hypothetical protein
MRINKKVKIIAMVNDEWQYQPLNLGVMAWKTF